MCRIDDICDSIDADRSPFSLWQFECLLFYVHDVKGDRKGDDLPPRELKVECPAKTHQPGMKDTEWYYFTPREELKPDGQQQKILPHRLEKRRYYVEEGMSADGTSYVSFNRDEVHSGGIKLKIPFEPVGSLLMGWKSMHRLRTECDWLFDASLTLLMDAIEYYLMLGEWR